MRFFVVMVLWIMTTQICTGQNQEQLIRSLSAERLFQYNNVQFSWKLEGKLQVFLNEGINFLEDGNLEASATNLDEFIRIDSSFWPAYYYRGVTNKILRRFRKAESDFRKATMLNPASYESIIEWGKIYHLKSSFKEAERRYNSAINLAPQKPIAFFLKGELEFHNGNYRAAMRNYKICLEKDANFSDATTKMAMLEIIKEKNVHAGLPYLNETLAKDSSNQLALIFRAIINSKKAPKNSLKDYNRLVKQNPQSIQFLLYRGLLLIDMEDYESAFIDLRKVIQSTGEDENNFVGQQTVIDKRIDVFNAGNYILRTIYGLNDGQANSIKKSYCLLLISKLSESIDALNNIKDFEKLPIVYFLQAMAYEHMGNHQEALKNYNLALLLDNDIFDAHKKRCIYRAESKDIKGAFEDLKEMNRIQPNSLVTYRIGGLIKITNNDFVGSILDFTKYLKIDTSNTEIWRQRGLARSKMGDKKGGNEDLKKAIMLNPSQNEDLFDFVSQQYLEMTDTLSALSILKKYVIFSNGHPIARLNLASLYADKKDWYLLRSQLDSVYDKVPTFNSIGSLPSNFFYLKARYYAGINENGEALKFLEKSLTANPSNLASRYLLGEIYIKTNKQKKAVKEFKALAEANYRDSRKILTSLELVYQHK